MGNMEKALAEMKPGDWVFSEDMEIFAVPGGWVFYRDKGSPVFVPDIKGLAASRIMQ